MSEKVRFTSYIREDIRSKLSELSDETRVPISAYVDEAIEDLLKKYGIEIKKEQ